MLIGVRPIFLFGTAHHQKMCYDLVCWAHHAGLGVAVISNMVQAKSAQRVGNLMVLAQHDGWSSPAEQVGQLAALADFRKMARQQVLLVNTPP